MNGRNLSLVGALLIILLLAAGLSACTSGSVPTETSASTQDSAVIPPDETLLPQDPAGSISSTEGAGGIQPIIQNTQQSSESAVIPTTEPTPEGIRDPVNEIWGIELHRINSDGGLDLVSEAGVDWVRRNALKWSAVERTEGARNWNQLANLESEMQNAADEGIELLLVVRSTPKWARKIPASECGPILNDKISAFADFMYDAVARYSYPPYNVKYWEIGNEPDVNSDPRFLPPDIPFGCWGDPNDEYYGGGYYARVLREVYPKIKEANPDAQVLVGGLLLDCDPVNPPNLADGSSKDCTPSRYLEGILQAGGGEFFDGVSFHAYDFYGGDIGVYGNSNWNSSSTLTGPVQIAKARYIRSLLHKYGYPDKYLINTEVGLICGTDGTEPVCQTDEFNRTKAYYSAIAYASAIAEELRANVWYSITGFRSSGLVDSDWAPLPVYDAIRFSVEELQYAEYVGIISQYPGIMGYEFKDGDKLIWLLWSQDGSEHQVELPTPPSAVYDTFGWLKPRGQSIEITVEPVYIEWKP